MFFRFVKLYAQYKQAKGQIRAFGRRFLPGELKDHRIYEAEGIHAFDGREK